MTQERCHRIEATLISAFAPTRLLIKDQSHLHAGHAGARDGKGHFSVDIVSEKFAGLSRIARHRLVFDALDELMKSDIHALEIKTAVDAE